MLNEYSRNDGFQLEEITFGNGTSPAIGEKAKPAPEAVVPARPAFEPALERPASTTLRKPVLLAALPEMTPAGATAVSERAETRSQESFKDTESDVRARGTGEIAVDLVRTPDRVVRRPKKRGHVALGTLHGTVWQQRLDSTVAELIDMKKRIGGLLEAVSAQTSKTQIHEELVHGIATLREVVLRQESVLAAVTRRLDEVAEPIEAQREDPTSPQVAEVAEQLERQAEVIRALHEASSRHEAALDQLSEVVECLKAFRASAPVSARL